MEGIINFNYLEWHDAIITKIVNHFGHSENRSVELEVHWVNDKISSIIFEEVYFVEMCMSFLTSGPGILVVDASEYDYRDHKVDLLYRECGSVSVLKLKYYHISFGGAESIGVLASGVVCKNIK